MNNHHTFASDTTPNHNHRYYDSKYSHIEKVQKEIMQQHKYLESQLNQLRDNIKTMCHNGGVNCVGVNTSHVTNTALVPVQRHRSFYLDEAHHHHNKNYDPIAYKIRKF
ncbi:Clas84 [Clostera anastomosis granulovirus B]|uniref:Clas84 n=1 Tax=Clostera anastomosis granulovirus B TaxID=1986290 RepID=A0A0K0WSI9_9BBAC|nr:Clas84 [Clostera anastomosis granulovirus B]AKS25427.1 Clas84 [Clostera anastomosis granulovirus B]